MIERKVSRWQASGLHLLISIAIAAAALALMLLVWYPPPLFEAEGGTDLLFILVGVDVILGPLITAIVFRQGKRGMKFDLVVIGVTQLIALTYGVHVVFLARPAFIVFVKDRFEIARAVELEPAELAKAKLPQFSQPPVTGPLWAVADFPTDPQRRNEIVYKAMAGLDLQNFPEFWVTYGERKNEVLAKALEIGQIMNTEPGHARVIEAYLAKAGMKSSEVRYVLLRARKAWVAVLIDPQTAQPLKLLIVEKI